MIRRAFWLAMGASIGALVVRKLSRTAARLTPSGVAASLSESAGRLVDSVRDFVDDARAGAREREVELREGAGLDDAGPTADPDRPAATGSGQAGEPE